MRFVIAALARVALNSAVFHLGLLIQLIFSDISSLSKRLGF